MLLGMYPPKKNNYVIKESQKASAVPPVEGFDFGPWIAEMGTEALPFQTTVFPIQMNGHSYDFMLALDSSNCEKIKNQRLTAKEDIDKNVQKIVNESKNPQAKQLLTQHLADW